MPEAQYNTPPPEGKMRTLASLHLNSTFAKPEKHLGSKNPPLLELEPSQYVIDELHLLLRLSDVLIRNIIHLADQLDHESKLRQGVRGTHIQGLEKLVQCCGVHFNISPVSNIIIQPTITSHAQLIHIIMYKCVKQVQNENGKAVKGMYEWTSLTRAQNLLVL